MLNDLALHALALLGFLTAGVAVIQDLPIVPDMLAGAGAGFYAGLLLAARLERREQRELPPTRVRQIQVTWAVAGTLAGLAIGLLGELS